MNIAVGIIEALKEYWELAMAVVSGIFGWILGHRKSVKTFKKREFFDRINISLNIIPEDGGLLIRTLMEKSCQEVFLNSAAREMVIGAAQLTTKEDSILPLEDSDQWFCLNPILNEVSEKFALGFIKRDMGQPFVSERYLICLTSEVADTIRQRKIRAMMIKKELLQNLPEEIKVERTLHEIRVTTLRQLAKSYQENPKQFLEVEIAI